MTKRIALIEGMTCGHCESAIAKSLAALGKLTNISVESASGIAKFDGEISESELAAAIDDAGYKLISVSDE
jgi:copper chaperone CopZ